MYNISITVYNYTIIPIIQVYHTVQNKLNRYCFEVTVLLVPGYAVIMTNGSLS